MSTQHIKDQPQKTLTRFFNEEMKASEWKKWYTHSRSCSLCKQSLEKWNDSFVQKAESKYQDFPLQFKNWLKPSKICSKESSTQMWVQLKKHISRVCLQLFRGKTLIREEVLQKKATGLNEFCFSNIPLPKHLFYEEEVQLVFEEDPLDHSLNIGLQGSSAKIRLHTTLKVVYHSDQFELFEGKTIALGSMWSLNSQKAQNIHHFELIYQEH